MELLLHLSDDIAGKLQAKRQDLPRYALESLASAAYREGMLPVHEVQRMLGLGSRWETDELLKLAGASLEYSGEDLPQDREALGANASGLKSHLADLRPGHRSIADIDESLRTERESWD